MGIQAQVSVKEESYLASNLNNLLRERQLTVAKVADDLGMPLMTVRRLLLGETTDPRMTTLKALADYFGVSVDALYSDDHLSVAMHQPTSPQFVPVLSWDVLRETTDLQTLDLSRWPDWQPINLPDTNMAQQGLFALESRPSMYPRFPLGTLFIFDPHLKPQDGDIVLVRLPDHDITLRELIIDPPDWQLQSISNTASPLHYQKDVHEMVAVNVMTFFYNRQRGR